MPAADTLLHFQQAVALGSAAGGAGGANLGEPLTSDAL